MNPKTDAMIEHLLNQGAIQIESIDDEGYMLYKITDKLKSVNPKLYKELQDQFEKYMFELIDTGPKVMSWKLR